MIKESSQQIFVKKFNILEDTATFYNKLYSNEWNLYVKIDSLTQSLPNTIIKKVREHLTSKNINYKYLFASCGYGLIGYMHIGNNNANDSNNNEIERTIAVLKSIKNLDTVIENISNKKSKPLKANVLLDAIYYSQKHSNKYQRNIFVSPNLEENKINFSSILKECGKEIANEHLKKKSRKYPNYFAFKGYFRRKQVEIIPQINQSGSGQIYFLIREYDEAKKLSHFLYALCYIENYKIKEYENRGKVKKVYYPSITNNVPFIYVVIEKQSGNIVYVGVSEHIDSRIKRHFNSSERNTIKYILANEKMDDNSLVKGYAFWKIHGNISRTKGNLEKFLEIFYDFKTPWEYYDVRLLPLTDYKVHFKDSEITRELAEAYVMDTLVKENPDKIVYTEGNMKLFNKNIKEYNAPLFNCAGGTINGTRKQVQDKLNEHKELVSSTELREILLRTLIILRQDSSLSSKSLYEVLVSYGLTFEEALRHAVGLSLEEKFFFDEEAGQGYIEVNNGLHLCSKDLSNNILYKEKTVDCILRFANYPIKRS